MCGTTQIQVRKYYNKRESTKILHKQNIWIITDLFLQAAEHRLSVTTVCFTSYYLEFQLSV